MYLPTPISPISNNIHAIPMGSVSPDRVSSAFVVRVRGGGHARSSAGDPIATRIRGDRKVQAGW